MFKSERWNVSAKQVEEKVNAEFLYTESEKITQKDFQDALNTEQQILDKIKNALNLRVYLPLVRNMQAFLIDYCKGAYSDCEEKYAKIIVFTLLYVLMPYDIIPDFIPGIGYLDDAAVLNISKEILTVEMLKYKEWRLNSVQV